MDASLNDRVTISVRRAGKGLEITGMTVHGHSKVVLHRLSVRAPRPEVPLLDQAFLAQLLHAVHRGLGELEPLLPGMSPFEG